MPDEGRLASRAERSGRRGGRGGEGLAGPTSLGPARPVLPGTGTGPEPGTWNPAWATARPGTLSPRRLGES